MKDIEDIIYNANGTVTTVYSDGTRVTTTPNGGYTNSSGGTTTTPGTTTGTGYTNGTTTKPWWQTAIGFIPGIINSIFGGNTANAGTTGQYYPTQTSNTISNTNLILIAGVVIVLMYFFLKKK